MSKWPGRGWTVAAVAVLATASASLLYDHLVRRQNGDGERIRATPQALVAERADAVRRPTAGDRASTRHRANIVGPADSAPAVFQPLDPAIPTPSPLLAALRAEPPSRNPLELVARLGAQPATTARATRTDYRRGDQESFWLHDLQRQEYSSIVATLAVVTPQAYFWVERGQPYDPVALEAAARRFSDHVLPTVRSLFGHEWSPGIDGDARLHILHHHDIPGIAGFFSSSDEVPSSADPHSNAHEMFYINLAVVDPASDRYLALLAHELQHMIHWWQDRDESTWVNEGLADLAATVAGYPQQDGSVFLDATDTALLEWLPPGADNATHYAAAYLFIHYLHSRYGDRFIRQLVQEPANSANGVERALRSLGIAGSFDDLFLDWVVANAVDDLTWEGARFGYGATSGGIRTTAWPGSGVTAEVDPYGTDYYDLSPAVVHGDLRLGFRGDTSVGLMEPDPADRPVWWSGRGDNGDSRLTCSLDLASARQAELRLALWYELEPDWDYGYVRLSADHGQTWQPLAIPGTTDESPNGANFGAGLTGSSQRWQDVRIDLTPHCGRALQLRFEVVTDDAVSLTGMAIADLVLDAGTDPHSGRRRDGPHLDCQPEGWQYLSSRLPQRWGLQLIVDVGAERALHRIPVASDGTAALDLPNIPPGARLILAVSSLTPGTRNAAGYRLVPNNS